MRISRNHASTFVHWRRLVIVNYVTGRKDPCVALECANTARDRSSLPLQNTDRQTT
jgi:hypothetical protein